MRGLVGRSIGRLEREDSILLGHDPEIKALFLQFLPSPYGGCA
jgi:hypothetical protein